MPIPPPLPEVSSTLGGQRAAAYGSKAATYCHSCNPSIQGGLCRKRLKMLKYLKYQLVTKLFDKAHFNNPSRRRKSYVLSFIQKTETTERIFDCVRTRLPTERTTMHYSLSSEAIRQITPDPELQSLMKSIIPKLPESERQTLTNNRLRELAITEMTKKNLEN